MNRIVRKFHIGALIKNSYPSWDIIKFRCADCGEIIICGGDNWKTVKRAFTEKVWLHQRLHKKAEKCHNKQCYEQHKFDYYFDEYVQGNLVDHFDILDLPFFK